MLRSCAAPPWRRPSASRAPRSALARPFRPSAPRLYGCPNQKRPNATPRPNATTRANMICRTNLRVSMLICRRSRSALRIRRSVSGPISVSAAYRGTSARSAVLVLAGISGGVVQVEKRSQGNRRASLARRVDGNDLKLFGARLPSNNHCRWFTTSGASHTYRSPHSSVLFSKPTLPSASVAAMASNAAWRMAMRITRVYFFSCSRKSCAAMARTSFGL
jgi:hypothetical protein